MSNKTSSVSASITYELLDFRMLRSICALDLGIGPPSYFVALPNMVHSLACHGVVLLRPPLTLAEARAFQKEAPWPGGQAARPGPLGSVRGQRSIQQEHSRIASGYRST